MANKINRNYKLTIQDPDLDTGYYSVNLLSKNQDVRLTPASNTVIYNLPTYQKGKTSTVFEMPITMELDMDVAISTGENSAKIKLYNLNEQTRNLLYQPSWALPEIEGKTSFRKVILEGGYGKELFPLFVGVLKEGFSYREGVDQITYLDCVSSAFGLYNSFMTKAYATTVSNNQVISDIIQTMSEEGDLQKGYVTQVDGEFTKGSTIIGESFSVLNQFGVQVFIDNNKLNALQLGEVIGGGTLKVPLINSNNGLLGTPRFEGQGYLTISLMFQPNIRLGYAIELESDTFKWINGQYKVLGVKHQGIFSGTREGKLITTMSLWTGNILAKAIREGNV